MDLLPCLLPLGTSLRVNDLAVDADADALTVELEAIAPSCPCPSCQLPAERIHSHYHRTVVDLPWAELVCASPSTSASSSATTPPVCARSSASACPASSRRGRGALCD